MATLLSPLLLTIAVSFLIGVGLREYYNSERKFETFGTVRTFVLIGLLGFALFLARSPGGAAYVAGLAALGAILAIYYVDKLREKKGAGIIGILIGLLTFAIGPLSLGEPPWVVVLLAISVLVVLHSKGRIRRFTDRLESGEVLTVCKFLAIAAVVLPLIPADISTVHGWLPRMLAFLPVTPRQLWWAVVITTSISYAGYVAQVYLFPSSGLQLTGLIGGLYSSTATVLVIARRSARAAVPQAAAAVMLAVGMMYIRLGALVAIFQPALLAASAIPLIVMTVASFGIAAMLRPRASAELPAETVTPAASIRHPLELTAALVFAAAFALVAAVTKYVLGAFHEQGLRWLSFVVGFSDITPFVVSVLQGNLSISSRDVIDAIAIASASNSVLKAGFIWGAGSRSLARIAVPILLGFAAVSLLYAMWN
jgi:uncharacterized membrane protein (DUF4010 family)